MESIIYLLHVSVAAGLLAISVSRTRRIPHPYVLFSLVIVGLLMSDFSVRGYAPETVDEVSTDYLYELQLVFVGLCLVIGLVTFVLANPDSFARANPIGPSELNIPVRFIVA